MTQQESPEWSNYSLPSSVPPRAKAEIVWVPLSEHGILVAIGGVINPAFATPNFTYDPLTVNCYSKCKAPPMKANFLLN
jgi:hypothetical protein